MQKQQRKLLRRFIVADPEICHGKPTFLGTRVVVAQVLKQVAKGMPRDAITAEWRGTVTRGAIAEVVGLAQQDIRRPFCCPGLNATQEALDGWALNELVGHYVNYRKQASPSMQDLLPEEDFRLFAVGVRFPQSLARQTTLTPVRPGVYEVRHFTGTIRVVAVHELPQQEHNALLHLFSARTDLLRYGVAHYRLRSAETSTLLWQLFDRYRLEVTLMPDELEEMARETIEEILKRTPLKERLKWVTPDELLAALSPETRLKGLSPDDLLAALSPETRATLAQRLKDDGPLPNP